MKRYIMLLTLGLCFVAPMLSQAVDIRPIIPVSYTHLDVYKRQALFNDNIDCLDKLQNCKIDIGILDTYLREINKYKPKDFYHYL